MTDKLDKFLDNMDIPAPDENARKVALNMASSKYEAYQQEKNQKKFQGFFSLSRLMGRNNSQDRRTKMKNRKLVYGGMATAMVVVLAGGAALYQTRTHEMVTGHSDQSSYSSVGGGAALREAPSTEEVTDTMRDAIKDYNEEGADEAMASGESFIPVPVGPATNTGVIVADEEEIQEDPLERWRLLQEERGQKPANRQLTPSEEKEFTELTKNFEADDSLTEWRKLQTKRSIIQKSEKAKQAERAAPSASVPSTLSGNVAQGMSAEADMMIAPVPPIHPHPPIIIPEPMPPEKADNDKFEEHKISSIKQVSEEPVSTFSIDVDTASYSFVRRQLNQGRLPDPNAVRIEELVNYFPYDYQGPKDVETPFNANISVVDSPWKEGNKLIHIGIKGYDIDDDNRPQSNLVFLLDVSGSMNQPDKLPLLKNSFKLLLSELKPDDTVGIVVYAGSAGTVLPPTKVKNKQTILNALESLRAGGSTAGAAGIQGAYALAEQNFDEDAVNRIILATDGDFNVGMRSNEDLKKLIEKKRESGIFLSVLGFGQGNLNDHLMQTLAQNGNGIAAHIDSLSEAQKVLVDEATSSLFPIAKDVKIQVEFNPEIVSEYRLIGYETRELRRQDFNNDKIDAGDIGAGHTVTAVYEIVPKGSGNELYGQSRYQKEEEKIEMKSDFGNEYAFLKMRYKLPDQDTSTLITTPITTADQKTLVNKCSEAKMSAGLCDIHQEVSKDAAFSIAVAGFGQLLKNDQYMSDFDYDDVLKLAQEGKGADPFGYRAEFINLVRLAETLDND